MKDRTKDRIVDVNGRVVGVKNLPTKVYDENGSELHVQNPEMLHAYPMEQHPGNVRASETEVLEIISSVVNGGESANLRHRKTLPNGEVHETIGQREGEQNKKLTAGETVGVVAGIAGVLVVGGLIFMFMAKVLN